MAKTILIIDDSVPLGKLIKSHLEPDNVRVKCAHSGEAGLALAASLRPSLIVLDIEMPRPDGFDVCRRLKADPVTADIPVLFLTANPMVSEKITSPSRSKWWSFARESGRRCGPGINRRRSPSSTG
jgi:CheY-like chemotaxis protein